MMSRFFITSVLFLILAWGTRVDAITAPKDSEGGTEEDKLVLKVKNVSAKEKRKQCKKYEGKIISFCGDVFKVEKCRRRALQHHETVSHYLKSGAKIHRVKGDTITALPLGKPLDAPGKARRGRRCKQLEGEYVTYSYVDVYFVEKCKKRLFPDWDSYLRHRKTHKKEKGEILALTWREFHLLKNGKDMPSYIDEEFRKLLDTAKGIDIIPIDEACKGVEGKFVSYYSKIYKIEKCRKREIDASDFTMRYGATMAKNMKELTSEQWISLPDGRPIRSKRKKVKPIKPING